MMFVEAGARCRAAHASGSRGSSARYAKIATMTPVRDKYKQQLLQERVMTGQQVQVGRGSEGVRRCVNGPEHTRTVWHGPNTQEVEAEIVDTLDDHKRNANKCVSVAGALPYPAVAVADA